MWGEGRVCAWHGGSFHRQLPALFPYFSLISLCYWLDGVTLPLTISGVCVPVSTGQAWGGVLTSVCVADLNLAWWDHEMPLRPQGGGSRPGRREGGQLWESLGKWNSPSYLAPAHNLACIRADGHTGVGCQLFPFKLIIGDMIWVLFWRSAWLRAGTPAGVTTGASPWGSSSAASVPAHEQECGSSEMIKTRESAYPPQTRKL